MIANPYSDFVIDPWSPEELIMRAYHLLSVMQAPAAVSASGPARRSAAASGPLKALVADDDLATSILISTALKSQGFEVTTARDGGEALQLAHNPEFSVVVLDINMPTLSGFEVLSALQAEGAISKVRVLVVSNRHQEADIVRAFALGAVDYVTKPFSPLELAARARRILAI